MQQAWTLEIKGNSQLGQDRRGLAQPTARAWGQAGNIGQSGLENRTTLLTNTGLNQAGIQPSVGSKGHSYDNALAETINRLYKTKLIHKRGPWKTTESVELATLQWVHWYNHTRLLDFIGKIPPTEAEANYYRQLA